MIRLNNFSLRRPSKKKIDFLGRKIWVSDIKKGGKELNKTEKVRVISELQGKFAKAKGVIFTDYRGLSVEEMSDLRNTLRKYALEYRVIKNTLARRAAEGTPVDTAKHLFLGPVGLAVGYNDPILLTKKIIEYNRANEKLRIKGGVIEGDVCTPDEIKTISELPSRENLLSMLGGVMQSPLSKFAGILSATLLQFVYAIEALKKQKSQ